MQKLVWRFVAIAVIAFSSLAARADAVLTLSINGGVVLSGLPGTVTGTLVYDTTTGDFTGLDAVVSDSNTSFTFSGFGNSVFDTGSHTLNVFTYDLLNGTQLAILDLVIPTTTPSLGGYSGGLLCTLANPCKLGSYFSPDSGNTIESLQTGNLAVQTAATPEPATFALLGTGLVGLWGAARRRVRV